jgi:RHS repeat-associated protein
VREAQFYLDGSASLNMADPDHELIRFGVRDYQPSTGRWAAKDPILFGGGFNLYAYVGNDPVNRADREGTCEPVEFVIIVILIASISGVGIDLSWNKICGFFHGLSQPPDKSQPVLPSGSSTYSPTYIMTNPKPPSVTTTEFIGELEVQRYPDGSLSFKVDGRDFFLSPDVQGNLDEVVESFGSSG